MESIFIPGSEWLYFKIYTGYKTADKILIIIILKLVNQLKELKLIDKWFFIRYSDPDFHVRFRLKICDLSNWNVIIKLFHDQISGFVKSGLVIKIQIDTYVREIERYGIETMENAEFIFTIDSEAILGILLLLEDEKEPDKTRWLISSRLIDDVLSSFNFSLEEKLEFIHKQSSSFKGEFGYKDHYYIRQLDAKYRSHRTEIENCFKKNLFSNEIESILNFRLDRLIQISAEINGHNGNISPNQDVYISSLIHMTMNRLFRSSNRIFELVIYDFLRRYYTSAIARSEKK